jgi:hypothetical protein
MTDFITLKNGKKVPVSGYMSHRFREAKRQNHGYEFIMEDLQRDLENNPHDLTNQALYQKITDAERNRMHKSFDYHWITRAVEEEVEDNPNITRSKLFAQAKSIHSDVTDTKINSAISQLKHDHIIKENNGHYTYQGDYINN